MTKNSNGSIFAASGNKRIKLTKSRIARAVSAAILAVASRNALPFDVSAYREETQVTVRMSGAIVNDQSLMLLSRLKEEYGGVCADNTNDTYISPDGLNWLVLCTTRVGGSRPLPSAIQGTRIAIHKSSQPSGSIMGIVPLVRDRGLANPRFWLVPTGGGFLTACAGVVTPPPSGVGEFSTYVLHANCENGVLNARVPDIGISDLEPRMFSNTLPSGLTPLTATELNAIPPNAVAGTIYGVPVTLRARDNMQRIQFPAGSPCHPDSGTAYNSADETESCVPSLTRAQLAALFTQNYFSWAQIMGDSPGESIAAPDSSGAHELASGGEVFICRKHSTYGTQAIFESHFLRQRCVSGGSTFASQVVDSVHVTESLGDDHFGMRQCLSNHNAAGRGAIGMMSLNFSQMTNRGGTDDGFRIIKIDGAAPCLLPAFQSKYELVMESSMQWRTANVNGLLSLQSSQRALAITLRSGINNGVVLQRLNATYLQPMCSGLGKAVQLGNALAVNPLGVPVPPFVVGGGGPSDIVMRPVLTRTRALAGGLNSCAPLVDLFPTQLN